MGELGKPMQIENKIVAMQTSAVLRMVCESSFPTASITDSET